MTIARFFLAAGLGLAALGMAGAADAQRYGPRDHHPGYDRAYHGHRFDGGRHRGWRGGHCHTEWRHHRRVRVCR